MKCHVILPNVNHPFFQCILSVYTTCLLVMQYPSQLPDLLSRCHRARVQVTLVLRNNGPKAQE